MEQPHPEIEEKRSREPWFVAHDRFWLAAVPKMYEWLRWAALLGAATYVFRQSDNLVLKALLAFLYGSLLFYYFAFFEQVNLRPPLTFRNRWLQAAVSAAFSAMVVLGTFKVVTLAADAIANAQGKISQEATQLAI